MFRHDGTMCNSQRDHRAQEREASKMSQQTDRPEPGASPAVPQTVVAFIHTHSEKLGRHPLSLIAVLALVAVAWETASARTADIQTLLFLIQISLMAIALGLYCVETVYHEKTMYGTRGSFRIRNKDADLWLQAMQLAGGDKRHVCTRGRFVSEDGHYTHGRWIHPETFLLQVLEGKPVRDGPKDGRLVPDSSPWIRMTTAKEAHDKEPAKTVEQVLFTFHLEASEPVRCDILVTDEVELDRRKHVLRRITNTLKASGAI